MPEPDADAAGALPPGGPRPPAPPGTGEPPGRRGPDPSDPGPPIPVALGSELLGDLGHPAVDARLLQALLLRNGRVAAWLRSRGVDLGDVERAFPRTGWD